LYGPVPIGSRCVEPIRGVQGQSIRIEGKEYFAERVRRSVRPRDACDGEDDGKKCVHHKSSARN
jgi:hypothetical protein